MEEPIRYSIIKEKNPREIVMLRGRGCQWKRCSFCDYHMDYGETARENFAINQRELAKVQGLYHRLEVINSGSFPDLDADTMNEIRLCCLEHEIWDLHFECHWMHRNAVPALKKSFQSDGIHVHIKSGAETFDVLFREKILHKGFGQASPEEIAAFADDVCLLFGLHGQTKESMTYDIETALRYFNRVCVNIMSENTTDMKPDPYVIQEFETCIAPRYQDNERVDLLWNNTDFGVGEISDYQRNTAGKPAVCRNEVFI